jgi:hypothetical protein
MHWKGGRSAGSRATDAPAAGTARSTASATRVSSTWPERVAASTKEGPSQSSVNQPINQSIRSQLQSCGYGTSPSTRMPHQWQQIYTSERSLCLSLSLYLELYVRGKRKKASLGGGLRIRRENLPAALAGIGAACTLDETGIPIRTIDINRTLPGTYARVGGCGGPCGARARGQNSTRLEGHSGIELSSMLAFGS